jgi:predicted RNase H-like nuclease
VRTDDEIRQCLPDVAADVVVAIDAPVLVSNATGQRACEREVGVLFSANRAGAHPSNLGRPHMNPTRASRLAAEHGWATDPAIRPRAGQATCIEVYPHPAMVVIFGLDRVIPYKNKRGRGFDDLKVAHTTLLAHLERCCGKQLNLAESPDWARLRAGVAGATRKVDLRVVEDQADAVLCAHLAWLWARHPDRMMVLPADRAAAADDGYIVVPRRAAFQPSGVS